ncbi:MAG: DNA alkylation repair protein [Halanaerobiales bacterium]
MVNDFSVKKYIKRLEDIFEQHADKEKAVQMEKYMRNKIKFYGIQAKQRRKLSSPRQSKYNSPPHSQLSQVVIKLWSKGQLLHPNQKQG